MIELKSVPAQYYVLSRRVPDFLFFIADAAVRSRAAPCVARERNRNRDRPVQCRIWTGPQNTSSIFLSGRIAGTLPVHQECKLGESLRRGGNVLPKKEGGRCRKARICPDHRDRLVRIKWLRQQPAGLRRNSTRLTLDVVERRHQDRSRLGMPARHPSRELVPVHPRHPHVRKQRVEAVPTRTAPSLPPHRPPDGRHTPLAKTPFAEAFVSPAHRQRSECDGQTFALNHTLPVSSARLC